MSDIFSLKTIPITGEIGMAFKNFRIEYEVTAKSIIIEFEKSSSYITKLEKGEIKKIDSNFFINLCNFITHCNDGLALFLTKASKNYLEYSEETKLILQNIDDLLIQHTIPKSFLADINEYIEEHHINFTDIVNNVNSNTDLLNKTLPDNIPENQWHFLNDNNDIDSAIIKLNIPSNYIESFLNGTIKYIHYVIAEAILYSIYKLGNERNAQILANSKLKINNFRHHIYENVVAVNNSNMDTLFGNLRPDVSKSLQDITHSLKLIINLSKEDTYVLKRLSTIKSNLDNDLGFTFAFMSSDLEKLSNKTIEKKQQFLTTLKLLIDEFSKEEKEITYYE